MDNPENKFEIRPGATEKEVSLNLDSRFQDDNSIEKIIKVLSSSGFSVMRTQRKVVFRRSEAVNFFQKEVWILAFDLNDKGEITARRVSRRYLAP